MSDYYRYIDEHIQEIEDKDLEDDRQKLRNITKSRFHTDLDLIREKFLKENTLTTEEVTLTYKVLEFVRKEIGG